MRKIGDQVFVLSEQDRGIVTGIMDGGQRYRVDTDTSGENWYYRWDVIDAPQAVIVESEPRPHITIARGTYGIIIKLVNMGTLEEREADILSALCGEFPGLNDIIRDLAMVRDQLKKARAASGLLIHELISGNIDVAGETANHIRQIVEATDEAICYTGPTITPVPDTTA